tara:strand:- start:803 stop:1381 length:579 start_codon:yes stop_codon:yes gene_type:complete
MALTKTAVTAAGDLSPKISPNSITKVNTFVRPSDQGTWTTSAPYVFYTAPTNCKYARIVIPYAGGTSNSSYPQESFKIESNSQQNHWLGVGIVNDTNSTEDIWCRTYSGNNNFPIHFNQLGQTYNSTFNITPFDNGPFGVYLAFYSNNNNYNYAFLHQDRLVLNPGEKFVGFTGNNSNSSYIYANFQAWVYN